MTTTTTRATTRAIHRCPECKQLRHDLMFPFSSPDAQRYGRTEKSDVKYRRIRLEAQMAGRDYSRCLPCINGDS